MRQERQRRAECDRDRVRRSDAREAQQARDARQDGGRQLERELQKLEGGSSSGGFSTVMNSTGAVLAKHQIQSLNSLTYEKEKNELRLDLLVENYDKLQALMADMKAAGINVEIQNSNAQGDQLRARLRVGE